MKYGFTFILSWFFIINIIISTVTIILERKRPEKTIAWLLIFIFLPPLGLILYIFLGRNWKRNKLNEEFSPYVKDLIQRVIKRINDPDYVHLIELIANTSNSPLFVDNEITIFKDGTEKFKALKEELEKAKHHIHLEYYIVKSDGIGNEIKDILIRKAKEGVKIRFIMDRMGAIRTSRRYIKELRDAGVDVAIYSYFLAPFLRFINTQINYRNHRKIAVIDGRVGFIGGNNIGDEYLGKGKLGYWRDTHIMVKGDFVLGLQGVFIDDFWAIKKVNEGRISHEKEFDKYFPKPEKSGKKIMQLITSGPDYEVPAIMHSILKMITIAKDHIYIATPYFVPSESIMDALKVAALGGIDIRILFPGRYDHFTVYYASRTYLAELLKYGVKVYLYREDAFVHSKVMTVDGKISTVGTANMDIRSFELNYEINSVIYDEEVTKKLEDMFLEDIKESRLMTLEDYENSPKHIKVIEAVSRIFSSLL
ncbi:cardiolipin synthase [Fonticella tunisiensis]|uniref:Cardiolipin synthase n=1 Tax=Fonticella tunisiensis TaxID=1096341 RepID=A0A4R7KUH0_9CLOT|nr:cardiolipin synthase [Fonticella tunisiensis]